MPRSLDQVRKSAQRQADNAGVPVRIIHNGSEYRVSQYPHAFPQYATVETVQPNETIVGRAEMKDL